ncbi:MAG: trehalase family glycosidase [Bacteroidales bacterium]|nr:trehalase family glycosidase [Bacteroidales bacterium]
MFKYLVTILTIFIITPIFAQNLSPFPVKSLWDTNILNLENDSSDEINIFSDLGAWFGFGFNENNASGFAGPYFLTEHNGYWLHNRSLELIVENEKGKKLNLECQQKAVPGALIQSLSNDSVRINTKLIYTRSNSVLVQYSLYSGKKQSYQLIFSMNEGGNIHSSEVVYSMNSGLVRFVFEKDFRLTANTATRKCNTGKDKPCVFYVEIRFEEYEKSAKHLKNNQKEQAFVDNSKRWENYLRGAKNLSSEHAELYAKSLMTLINNWRTARSALKHDGIFPSTAYKGFHGFWAWDSWKHSVALAAIEPSLAKNQIRAMFDYQNEDGMVADCIFSDTLIEKPNERNTKPPLSAWAVWQILQFDPDTAFAKEMLPKLIKYHEWWYKFRDYNNNGICEYGSNDGSLEAAAWESGMDNAVRFDSAIMIKSTDKSWSMNQESVDLNAFLCAEKIYISQIAGIAGDYQSEHEYGVMYAKSIEKIRQWFYDEETAYFFDKNTSTGKAIKIFGPEAWIMLWTGLASPDEAYGVMKIIMNEDHFNTFVPFPTLSASHPSFNPQKGYWRGPVWIDQAYFALEGLLRYGYHEEANNMMNKLLLNSEGLLNSDSAIHENYNPINGKALNASHFSWSAAHLIMLLQNKTLN